MFTIDVRHDGLGRLLRIVAPVRHLAESRAAALLERWDQFFQRREQILRIGGGADPLKTLEAGEATREAEAAAGALTGLLLETLALSKTADWSPRYDTSPFGEAAPVAPEPPLIDPEPKAEDFPVPPFKFWMLLRWRVLFGRKKDAAAKFAAAHKAWAYLKQWRQDDYRQTHLRYSEAFAAWDKRKTAFLVRQEKTNARLTGKLEAYQRGEAEGVLARLDLALLMLPRPQGFACYWTARFDNGTVVIDYELPAMTAMPVVKAVRYMPSRGLFQSEVLAETRREQLYAEAVFQTCLAVLHMIFAADTAMAVRAVVFQGWANFIDTVELKPGRACILSVTADRARFGEIDLAAADPVSAFRALNGVMSPKLAALAAEVL